jgi:hypothetical protein
MFIEENKSKLARELSRGYGETLESLSKLIGVTDEHRPVFVQVTKANFSKIFPGDQVTSKNIVASLKQVLEGDAFCFVCSSTFKYRPRRHPYML